MYSSEKGEAGASMSKGSGGEKRDNEEEEEEETNEGLNLCIMSSMTMKR